MLKWLLILWPSFMVAVVAELVFFTVIDPQQLYLFGEPVAYSKIATYSIGFFSLWAVCAVSSLVTVFLLPSAKR
jgi:hypothetical protein